MPFKKGIKKSGGRVRGTPNVTTKEARDLLVQIMNNQIPNIDDALNQIKADSSAKYVDALAKLFQYTIPKQLDIKTDGEKITDVKVTYIDKINGDTGK